MIYSFSERYDWLKLTCKLENGAVRAVDFGPGANTPRPSSDALALWERVRSELWEYVRGERREFDLPLSYDGTEFQRLVWDGLRAIPYGETQSYGELARRVGRPGSARAVGGACRSNPIAVIIPCHRVVGASGALTGFGGGLEIKERLLRLEGFIK